MKPVAAAMFEHKNVETKCGNKMWKQQYDVLSYVIHHWSILILKFTRAIQCSMNN